MIIPDPSSSADVSIDTLRLKNNSLEHEIETLQSTMNATLEELSIAQNNVKLLQEKLDTKIVPSDMKYYPEPKYGNCYKKLEKEELEKFRCQRL